ncbi:unnamed protein product [Caretta caretta]
MLYGGLPLPCYYPLQVCKHDSSEHPSWQARPCDYASQSRGLVPSRGQIWERLDFYPSLYRVTDGDSSFPREKNLPECRRMSIIGSHVIAPADDVPTIWHEHQSRYPLCLVEMPLSPPFG